MDDTAFMTHKVQDIFNAINEMLIRWSDHDLPSDFLPVAGYPFNLALEDIHAEVGASLEFLQDDHALPFVRQNEALCKDLTRRDMLDHVLPAAEFHAGGMRVMMRYLDHGWLVKLHDNWGDPEDGTIVVHRYHPDHDPDDRNGQTETYFIDGQDALKYWLETSAPEPLLSPEGYQMRPLTDEEQTAYLAGHRTFPGAVETEHGVMVPAKAFMTLGELRAATGHLPDDMPVTIAQVDGGWYNNVHLGDVPSAWSQEMAASGEAEQPSLVLEQTDNLDTRQW